MNYAETLAYWYLRLNGFFPILDFVLHSYPTEIEHSADADLLALRMPHVYESVGGQESDWDAKSFASWGLELDRDIIGLIVEVTTGRTLQNIENGVTRAFNKQRLKHSVQRFGLWESRLADQIVEEFSDTPLYRRENIVIAKLLVTSGSPRENAIPSCLKLPLDQADSFIRARMRAYRNPKMRDRFFFPSDLIQYIIWGEQAEERKYQQEMNQVRYSKKK